MSTEDQPEEAAEQHDNHCLLVFQGCLVRVVAMRGLACVVVRPAHAPHLSAVLDLAAVDWDEHVRTATAMIGASEALLKKFGRLPR